MKYQQGIGLIEVMVALMLLAVAMLGFSSMQMFAVKSTDESVMRTRAMTVIRGGSEMMRANLSAIDAFKTTLNTGNPAVAGITTESCLVTSATTATCNSQGLASRDALVLKDYATKNELQIQLEDCPGLTGSQARQCFITSWGATKPNFLGQNDSCAETTGVYKSGSQCFIVEAY